jgi:hypothetical protein
VAGEVLGAKRAAGAAEPEAAWAVDLGLLEHFVGGLGPETGRWHVPFPFFFGTTYGLAVFGVMRLFETRAGGNLVAGLLAGHLPAALLLGAAAGREERGGLLPAGALLGALEWARPLGAEGGGEPSS